MNNISQISVFEYREIENLGDLYVSSKCRQFFYHFYNPLMSVALTHLYIFQFA